MCKAFQTIAILFLALLPGTAWAAPATQPSTTRGDRMIADYFRNETALLSRNCLSEIKTRQDWDAKKGEYRRQLEEMLGLWPMPAKTDLHPVITGKIDSDDFTVERLYFQSMPHLYVTGDLYLPNGRKGVTTHFQCIVISGDPFSSLGSGLSVGKAPVATSLLLR